MNTVLLKTEGPLKVFSDLSSLAGVENVQLYTPLLKKLSPSTELSLNHGLKSSAELTGIKSQSSENSFCGEVVDKDGNMFQVGVFLKFSPLIDPILFMTSANSEGTSLPSPGAEASSIPVNDPNNASYVDSFFSYIASELGQQQYFPHAPNYFGSYIGSKTEFKYDFMEERDYLVNHRCFIKNCGVNFELSAKALESLESDLHSLPKKPITISTQELDLDLNILEPGAPLPIASPQSMADDERICSSDSSNTESEDDLDDSGTDDEEEQTFIAKLKNFPTNVIALDKLDGTLDSYLETNELRDDELASIAFQIIITLIAYGRAFDLTHNDLHTNNVMYCKTDKKHIQYRLNGQYYKVPTFGKIYKIIDFGRSIYRFGKHIMISGSYAASGDAAGLFNIDSSYSDTAPPRLPNKSFDLCRLGCSLFEFIETGTLDPPAPNDNSARALMLRWCLNDQGKNMLYKRNGQERYPNFKLYKMIVKSVNCHEPENEVQHSTFDRFKTIKKYIQRKQKIVDVDSVMPWYQKVAGPVKA